MLSRGFSRILVGIALLCASVAWTGWVLLQTVADPSRSTRIAEAVLDDPEARDQLADNLASALANAVNAATSSASAGTGTTLPRINGDDPTLRRAVSAALADPAVVRDLAEALAAAHGNLLGVEPKQPAEIDTTLLTNAVTKELGPLNPALAKQISGALPESIDLPEVEIPLAGRLRDFATAAVPRLTILAIGLGVLAFVTGDRPRVLRRVGTWAVGAGLLWVVLPRVIVWAAERWMPGSAAVVRAVLTGTTGVVTAMATILFLCGVGAVGASIALARMPQRSRRSGVTGTTPRTPRADAPLTPGWRAFTGRDMPPSTIEPPPRFDQRT
jgi:hypothetical protein